MATPRGKSRKAKPDPLAARRNGVREVGELLPKVGELAFRRFGFHRGVLLARWSEIVGPVYARWSVPESLRPQRGQAGGILTVRVEGAFALQLQHIAPQLIERVNRIIGGSAVARLRLVQGEVVPPGVKVQAPPPAPAAGNVADVDPGRWQGIADSGLRAALQALAAEMAHGGKPPPVR